MLPFKRQISGQEVNPILYIKMWNEKTEIYASPPKNHVSHHSIYEINDLLLFYYNI